MDDHDDQDARLLRAAATVHDARRRLRRDLGPLLDDRHRIPSGPDTEQSAVDAVLGAAASARARAAWELLDAALADHPSVGLDR